MNQHKATTQLNTQYRQLNTQYMSERNKNQIQRNTESKVNCTERRCKTTNHVDTNDENNTFSSRKYNWFQ